MSQQTNAGFNAPGFSVVADDPACAMPCTAPSGCPVSACMTRCGSGMPVSVGRIVPAPRAASCVVGVGHIASACARIATSPAELPASLLPSFAGASDVGVGHIAAATCRGSWSIRLRPSSRVVVIPGESFQSRADAVTHSAASVGNEPETVTTVGRIDGTSRDNDSPAGVADACQVSMHSVEPVLANRRRNLLSHEDSGPSGTDEAKQVGPQVPVISLGFAFSGD